MSDYVFKLPDLGEGTVEAEIVRWHVKPGDVVCEDQAIVELMTDKATVEVPAPVDGRVLRINGEPGDKVPVGAPLVVFARDAEAGVSAVQSPVESPLEVIPAATAPPERAAPAAIPVARVMASPATRRRAREAGIDLAGVAGSGPGGRILRGDLVQLPAKAAPSPPADAGRADEVTEIKIIGLRRLIAERMSEAKRSIPHFAYVEEVDVTELEALRAHLNASSFKDQPALSYLPFVIAALARVLESFPQCNVRHDAVRGVLIRHRAVHVGIATQTPDGLKVPVLRDCGSKSLGTIAAQIRELSARARANQSSREELSGSTITVTSLGKLGGIVSTPVINAPEVAIVGLNKALERPVVRNGAIVVRRIMNLSSSFDHRFVDGYDAAAMIQALKDTLEHPATIFLSKDQSP
ncbi:MAG TPA: dihydrolipoamide acetyltransferase family protein [Steroidobacteraceae bacterium]|nr:dihydrolipoamide acetyltransferase family protein [Steroidobacteraceae bacterium]